MAATRGVDDPPEEFRHALERLRSVRPRAEVRIEPAPAPQRLAPHAVAFTATVHARGEEVATGRLVVLYDPQGQESWQGRFRVVAYVRATLEPEMAADPLVTGVGWTWLTEALDERGATSVAPSGTVTKVTSESFGDLAARPESNDIEVRASWTPVDADLAPHLSAWCDLLCACAGLPPSLPGVVSMPSRREPLA